MKKFKLVEHNDDIQLRYHNYADTRKYLEVGKVYEAFEDVHPWHTILIIDGKGYNSVCFEEVSIINFSDVSIWDDVKLTWTPCNSLTFGNGIGKLTWESGKCVFEGDAEESAKIFFNYVCSLLDTYNQSHNGEKHVQIRDSKA